MSVLVVLSVLFFLSDILSHEWVSRKHGIVKCCIMLYDAKLQLCCLADPRGEQLKELQLLFRRMLRGEVRVQTDSSAQIFMSNYVVLCLLEGQHCHSGSSNSRT